MAKIYEVSCEVEGPLAMYAAAPDSGSEQSTSLVPNFGAVKGTLESIAYLRHAEVIPTRVHICRPIQTMTTGFNYVHGPLRKSINGTTQNHMTMLTSVVYQFFANVKSVVEETARYATNDILDEHGNIIKRGSASFLHRINHAHSYQAQFFRRLKKGKFYRPVSLGKAICMATYVGPIREGTRPLESVNLDIPFLLKTIYTKPMFGEADMNKAVFYRNISVKNGVLIYA